MGWDQRVRERKVEMAVFKVHVTTVQGRTKEEDIFIRTCPTPRLIYYCATDNQLLKTSGIKHVTHLILVQVVGKTADEKFVRRIRYDSAH